VNFGNSFGTFHLTDFKTSNNKSSTYNNQIRERRGTFSFCNRLNDIIPLLSDKQLNENEPETKRIFKPKNLETLSDKCDIFLTLTIIFLNHDDSVP